MHCTRVTPFLMVAVSLFALSLLFLVVSGKCDLLPASQRSIVREYVRLVNHKADVVECSFGKLDPKVILGTGKFDAHASMDSPLLAFAAAEWHADIRAKALAAAQGITDAPAHSEAAEYGISSFVWHSRVGFSADRFEALLREFESARGDSSSSNSKKSPWTGLLRVKGVFWIDQNTSAVGLWQATRPGTKPAISVSASGR